MADFKIIGRVIQSETKNGIAGLKVESWDKDLICNDLVGSSITDSQGGFTVSLNETYFAELFLDRQPDLFFKVFQGAKLIKSTENAVIWNAKSGDLPITIEVELKQPRTVMNVRSEVEPQFVPFIPAARIKLIFEAVDVVFQSDKEGKETYNKWVEDLYAQSSALDLLLNDARALLRGDTYAGNRMLEFLNDFIIREKVVFAENKEGSSRQTVAISDFPTDQPRLSLPRRNHCLFSAGYWGDIILGIKRLPDFFPDAPDDIPDKYIVVANHLVETATPLELLYGAARDVLKFQPNAAPYFMSAIKYSYSITKQGGVSKSGPMVLPISIDAPFGEFPGLGRGDLFFDFCRLERWIETERAQRCFTESTSAPRYGIADIVNLSRTVEGRRGCWGERIEIRGHHLGSAGRIWFGEGSGIDAEIDLDGWHDDHIRFIIPSGVVSDRINICIFVASCPAHICRLAEAETDHSFEVVPTPAILEFSPVGLTALPGIEHAYMAAACTSVQFVVRAHAEYAIIRDITDEAGHVTIGEWGRVGAGTEISERIVSDPFEVRASGTRTYRLEVSNFCGSAPPQDRTIEFYRSLSFIPPGSAGIDTGNTVDLGIRISCSVDGDVPLRINLSSDNPDNVSVEATTEVLPGRSETTVRATAVSPGRARITASAEGYREDEIALRVVPLLHDNIEPNSNYLNEEVTLNGAGFQRGMTRVYFGSAVVPFDSVRFVSDTRLRVNVPNQAGTPVRVEVVEGMESYSSSSLPFTVLNPILDGIVPPAELRGRSVTLNGRGFSTEPTANKVRYQEQDGSRPRSSSGFVTSRQLTWRVPSGSGAVTGLIGVIVERLPMPELMSPETSFGLLRIEGPFYELRTEITDDEDEVLGSDHLLRRECSAGGRSVRIEPATDHFSARFYEGTDAVGMAYEFYRHPFSESLHVGGANISHLCAVGVVINGTHDPDPYVIQLIDAETGVQLLEGRNEFPKVRIESSGSATYIEPRVWLSQDDSIVMMVGATSESSGTAQFVARFIDVYSGRRIAEPTFSFPARSSTIDFYSAEIDNSTGHSRIIFSVIGAEPVPLDIP